MNARLPGAAFSTRKLDDEPNSPPAEKPCTSRAISSTRGAARPITEYVGMTAMSSDAPAMSMTVRVRPRCRPCRSANAPSTAPPTGRIRNPTANTASVASRLAVLFEDGKNDAENTGEK